LVLFSRVRRGPRRITAGISMSETCPLKPITVTVATALAVTGIGRTKFYELVKEGRIRTVAIGRRTLVIFADLEKLAEARSVGK
jgi:excisionase family DNA binding protein